MSGTDTTTADRAAAAALLRQLRESRGWSWNDLATALRETARLLGAAPLAQRQLASIQRSIARWESPIDTTSPGERYQLLLAHLYARTSTGTLVLGPGSDFDTLLTALRHFGTPLRRLHDLEVLIRSSTTIDSGALLTPLHPGSQVSVTAALRHSTRLDSELLSQLVQTITAINDQIGSAPFARLQLLLAPVVEICRRLIRTDSPYPRHESAEIATDSFALAARLAFETRDDGAAISLYQEATDAAAQLPNPQRMAAIHASHAMVTLHAADDLDAASEIARAAVRAAHQGASYAIRARAHAVHAEICARAGQAKKASVALERAWKTLDQLGSDQPNAGFSAHRLNGFEGLCALHTGNARRAHDRLEESVSRLNNPRDAVQRGIVSTDLALARLRLGDPVACVELLHEAVDITARTHGRVSAQRIRQVRHDLRPWRAEAFLAGLDDHIHDTLIGR